MASAIRGMATIIDRARENPNIQLWLILAGDLDNFVADVLYHTVEEFIRKKHASLYRELAEPFLANLLPHLENLFCSTASDLKRTLKRKLDEKKCQAMKKNPIELAKLFCNYNVSYSQFSDMDVSCLLQIISNCNLFNQISREAVNKVRMYRNEVMHNKLKVVEENVFKNAFKYAELLLKDPGIESLWRKKNLLDSIESRLETMQLTPLNVGIDNLVIFALENSLTFLLYECDNIRITQGEIVDELKDMINLFTILVDKPVEVSDGASNDDDEISNLQAFRVLHKHKLELIKASVSSLNTVKENVGQLISDNCKNKEATDNLHCLVRMLRDELFRLANANRESLHNFQQQLDALNNKYHFMWNEVELVKKRVSSVEEFKTTASKKLELLELQLELDKIKKQEEDAKRKEAEAIKEIQINHSKAEEVERRIGLLQRSISANRSNTNLTSDESLGS